MDFAGKVAIVTGAGRGIGRAVALTLGRNGCQLSVAARSANQLVSLAGEVQKLGRQAIAVTTDVTEESAVTVLVDRTRAVFGRVDILVNAANEYRHSAFDDCSAETWHDLVAVNLTGPFLCTRAVVPIMKEQSYGKVINIADGGIRSPTGEATAYASVKSGLIGMTRSLAVELRGNGIQVNAICPNDREADIEDVAATALFLAGDGANKISGAVIDVSDR